MVCCAKLIKLGKKKDPIIFQKCLDEAFFDYFTIFQNPADPNKKWLWFKKFRKIVQIPLHHSSIFFPDFSATLVLWIPKQPQFQHHQVLYLSHSNFRTTFSNFLHFIARSANLFCTRDNSLSITTRHKHTTSPPKFYFSVDFVGSQIIWFYLMMII